jgi:hypothetical protein
MCYLEHKGFSFPPRRKEISGLIIPEFGTRNQEPQEPETTMSGLLLKLIRQFSLIEKSL